jgi:Fe-S cluster assembly protein SufD
MNPLELFQQQYEKQNTTQNWLNDFRQQAWHDFQQQGIPTLRQENWKYSNVSPIFKRDISIQQAAQIDLASIIAKAAIENYDCYRIVMVDGKWIPEHSVLPTAKEVEIIPLSSLSSVEVAKVEQVIAAGKEQSKLHPFANLNLALANESILISINKSLSKPIELLHISSAQQADAIAHSHQILYVNAHAHANFVERFISAQEQRYVLNSRCDILLSEQARLTHVRFESQSQQASHFRFIGVTQHRASHFDSYAFDFGGQFIRTDLVTRLVEKQAGCVLHGVYLVNQKQHVDNHTFIEHVAPECTSRQYYKGIIADSSRAVFNGKVIVQNTAQKTDAAQKNKNLLLSKTAEIDAKPELEIYADEVKCSHGATVGQLDEEAVFYLQARGISEESARSLMTYSFGDELIAQLPDNALVNLARTYLISKLPEGNVVKEYLQ